MLHIRRKKGEGKEVKSHEKEKKEEKNGENTKRHLLEEGEVMILREWQTSVHSQGFKHQ